MLDLSKHYQTQCGYPVRNLHHTDWGYEGDFLYKNSWHPGAWTCGGTPAIFTSDRKFFESLILTETSDEPFLPAQLDLF